MNPVFKVDLRGVTNVQKNLRFLRDNFPEWIAAANQETAEAVRDQAQRNIRQIDAYATGKMYGGIEARASRGGLVFTVGCTMEYAPFVEFGTRPHFPPIAAIREWCSVRGIPESAAYPICKKIAEHGTPERPFMYPALFAAMRTHIYRIRGKVGAGFSRIPAA